MGGKIWWKELAKQGEFRLQQNVISQHYRILDEQNYRLYSSFDEVESNRRLMEFAQTKK